MVYNPNDKFLYIFGGKRDKDVLDDFIVICTTSYKAKEISNKDITRPKAIFFHKSVINQKKNEIIIYSGSAIAKEKSKLYNKNQKDIWIYNVVRNTWRKVE